MTFRDTKGELLLAEATRSLGPVTRDPGVVDEDSFAVRQQFARAASEGLYGLGQQQSGDVNHAGNNVTLTTHNIVISIPFLVSTRGWGLLWNNASVTRVGSPAPAQPLASGFELIDAHGEPGALTARYYQGDELVLERREADPAYQFLDHGSVREHPFPEAAGDPSTLRVVWEGTLVAAADPDAAIAGYRRLTGKAVMLPRWAYGFWQSRERYETQDELVGVLEEYCERGIPIDNIVLDWFYWPEDAWGSHAFDESRFPDPKTMVQRVHALGAHVMISVWPKFYPTTEHYRALDERGCMFNKNIEQGNVDWVGPGYPDAFYDAFDADCGALYWRQVRDTLEVLGFDAWWLDATEPDMLSNLSFHRRKDLMTPNARGTGAEVFNAYALPHAEAV